MARKKMKTSKLIKFSKNMLKKFISAADFFTPCVDLAIRWWMAIIFWKSGVLKSQDWDTTLMLFEDEHPVPGLSPEIAAYLGTTNEIIMPILLIIGLGTRFAAIVMLFMTLVIQFTYMDSSEHGVWALLLVAIILRGAGRFSWDFFLRYKYLDKMPSNISNFSQTIALFAVVILTIFMFHEVLTLAIDDWNNPWFDYISETWDDTNKWLGSFARD